MKNYNEQDALGANQNPLLRTKMEENLEGRKARWTPPLKIERCSEKRGMVPMEG